MPAGAVTTIERALGDGGAPVVSLTCPVLEQRVARLPPGERASSRLGDESEILFVAAGNGVLRAGDEERRLGPLTGVFVAAGESVEIENTGSVPLDLVGVAVAAGEPTRPRVVTFDEEEAQDAGIGREFRLLAGCTQATQFVGIVPPGRAKMHNHPYDELAYLVEGEGRLHWEDGTSEPVAAGSCIYFPRLVFHSLENVGSAPLRIMGVFHPAGSPADRVAVLDY